MKMVSIWATKGGTGKTTLALNLAGGLAAAGAKVLLVDLDPQRSAVHFAEFAQLSKGTPLPFKVSSGYPKTEPQVDWVIVDHPPAHEIDNRPVGDLILVPFLPGPLDWWATQRMIDRLTPDLRERVRLIASMTASNRAEEREAVAEIQPAAAISNRSIYRRVLAHGGTLFSPGDLPVGAYGIEDARREMRRIISLVGG